MLRAIVTNKLNNMKISTTNQIYYVSADLAEAIESIFSTEESAKRAASIVHAIGCYFSEEGTTTKQDNLLKEIGVK